MTQQASRNGGQDITLKDAAEAAYRRIASACPEDGKVLGEYLAALHKKSVVALGEGEAFALMDAEGRTIKATKRTVRLTAKNGGLTQPVWMGPYAISALGYAMLAHAAGAVVMNANTVIVDGVEQQNPYVRRAPDGSIMEVHCRALAFRYNENGQPVVSDRTTIFDTGTYALADMIGKAKKHKDAFKLLPAALKAPGKENEWAPYPIDAAVTLWMNITHDEVINFLGQVLNRKKKALEFAQTFAQRNALKHLFGIAVVPGQTKDRPIATWDVPVVCWAPSDGGLVRFDTARYATSTQIIEALAKGRPVALPEASGPIVISRGTEEVRGSDIEEERDPVDNPGLYGDGETQNHAAALDSQPTAETEDNGQSVNVPEDAPADSPAPDGAPAEAWTQEQQGQWKNLQVTMEEFPDEYAAALRQLDLTNETVNPGNAGAVLRAIDSMLK